MILFVFIVAEPPPKAAWPSVFVPSVNVTVPVTVPGAAVTVAVNVTVWPAVIVLGFVVS